MDKIKIISENTLNNFLDKLNKSYDSSKTQKENDLMKSDLENKNSLIYKLSNLCLSIDSETDEDTLILISNFINDVSDSKIDLWDLVLYFEENSLVMNFENLNNFYKWIVDNGFSLIRKKYFLNFLKNENLSFEDSSRILSFKPNIYSYFISVYNKDNEFLSQSEYSKIPFLRVSETNSQYPNFNDISLEKNEFLISPNIRLYNPDSFRNILEAKNRYKELRTEYNKSDTSLNDIELDSPFYDLANKFMIEYSSNIAEFVKQEPIEIETILLKTPNEKGSLLVDENSIFLGILRKSILFLSIDEFYYFMNEFIEEFISDNSNGDGLFYKQINQYNKEVSLLIKNKVSKQLESIKNNGLSEIVGTINSYSNYNLIKRFIFYYRFLGSFFEIESITQLDSLESDLKSDCLKLYNYINNFKQYLLKNETKFKE